MGEVKVTMNALYEQMQSHLEQRFERLVADLNAAKSSLTEG